MNATLHLIKKNLFMDQKLIRAFFWRAGDVISSIFSKKYSNFNTIFYSWIKILTYIKIVLQLSSINRNIVMNWKNFGIMKTYQKKIVWAEKRRKNYYIGELIFLLWSVVGFLWLRLFGSHTHTQTSHIYTLHLLHQQQSVF